MCFFKLKAVQRVTFGHTFLTEAEQTWSLCELTWENPSPEIIRPNSGLFCCCCSVCAASNARVFPPTRYWNTLGAAPVPLSSNVPEGVFIFGLKRKKRKISTLTKWKCLEKQNAMGMLRAKWVLKLSGKAEAELFKLREAECYLRQK